MKKSILFLAAALLLTSVGAMAQNKIDKQGRRQGHWVRTDKDGSKIFEGDFVDGQETGTFTYYYHDGSVRLRNTYTVPGRVCTHEAYDEQGHLLARGQYNQRNRDGRWQFFAADGRVVKEAEYSMGVKHGLHVIFTSKGDTAEVTHWRNNHRHGRWWKRIGAKGYITGTYLNGGLEGRLVEYDDNGTLVRDGNYTDGFKHGSYRYLDAQGITVDEVWNHGTMTDRRIRLLTDKTLYVSIFDIACLAPQGKAKTVVVLKDGSKLICHEATEPVYDRIGTENFAYANRKGRVLVALSCVQRIAKDNEGRDILVLEPQPDFAIYPDEDGLKMVRSAQYSDDSPLDKLRGEKSND